MLLWGLFIMGDYSVGRLNFRSRPSNYSKPIAINKIIEKNGCVISRIGRIERERPGSSLTLRLQANHLSAFCPFFSSVKRGAGIL